MWMCSPTGGGSVAWIENLGAGEWSHRTIAFYARAEEVLAADLDSDGDLDIAVTAVDDNVVVWLENENGDASLWREHVVDAAVAEARGVTTSDIDGDRDPDLIAVGAQAEAVLWWENLFSARCQPGEYAPGDVLLLTASPAAGSGIERWSGTEADESQARENRLLMPASDVAVSVDYVPGCLTLDLAHIGRR